MSRNPAHAQRRNGRRTFREHLEVKLEETAGGRELLFEEDSGKEWAEEALDDLLGEVQFAQALDGGEFGLCEEVFGTAREDFSTELGDAQLVWQRDERIYSGGQRL